MKMIQKYTIAAILLFTVICSLTPLLPKTYASTPSFWAIDYINEAIAQNLVPQNLRSNYSRATTRAEFAALAVSLYENINGDIIDRVMFNDTNDVSVQKAAAIGVVNGMGDNRFAPNDTLTREQAATMLARLACVLDEPLTIQEITFADYNSISSWALSAVGQMQATGIMIGVGIDTFSPKGTFTREQSIVTVLRLYDMIISAKSERMPAPEPLLGSMPEYMLKAMEFESAVINLVNFERTSRGLQPLEWESRLASAAKNHSIDMSRRGFFAHVCPSGHDVWFRIDLAGMPYHWTITEIEDDGSWTQTTHFAIENIAHGYRTPEEVVGAWMRSARHRAAILSENMTHTGVGFHDYYWTQTFAGVSRTIQLYGCR